MSKKLSLLEVALLAELEAAHLIINNALALMDIKQITKLSMVNGEMELVEAGACRFDERKAVIDQAHAKAVAYSESDDDCDGERP